METKTQTRYFDLPIIIEATLYKYNYVDNIIITEIKSNAKLTEVSNDKNSFIVQVNDIKRILYRKFRNQIERIKNVSIEDLSSEVNTSWFLSNLIENFNQLQFIKINVSDKRNFTRLKIVNNQQVVGFSYVIKYGIIDYTKYLNASQLRRLNYILRILGYLKKDDSLVEESYFNVKAKDFLMDIMKLEETHPDLHKENADIIDITYDAINYKVEDDNTTLIVKTDFDEI